MTQYYAKEIQPMLNTLEKAGYASLNEAFPDISADDIGLRPRGAFLLVQMRKSRSKTGSGIILAQEAQDRERFTSTLAKILAVGPLAFKNRNTLEDWAEGPWAYTGDYIRVPRYGHGSQELDTADGEKIEIRFVKDTDIIALVDRNKVESLQALL